MTNLPKCIAFKDKKTSDFLRGIKKSAIFKVLSRFLSPFQR